MAIQLPHIQVNSLTVALEYHKSGFNIFPLIPSSKAPMVPWKDLQSRHVSESEIQNWWGQNANAGIAAIMGSISSNVVAIDIDPRNGGLESMKGLSLPDTRIHKTGGNGFHYFYCIPEVSPKKTGIYPGIDFIGEGGYCVMPPSLHASGQRYEVFNAMPIQEAPEWIARIAALKITSPESGVIRLGSRHNSITRSIRGYAEDTRHSFILLWKRAYTMAVKCVEVSEEKPFTFGELFNICLWAWNETHKQSELSRDSAYKMLAGRCKYKGDIVFGPTSTSLFSFHLKQLNITTSQHHSTSTSQSDTVTDKYIKGETCR